ncbi:alpha-L-fucosidase [Streptomyces xanthophaeus]|uniref:alpha-L-fucosidase n=1 Tax=Streptomyces xanthophaeus TaxID=67385 RepID=UPI0034455BB3
MSFPAINTSGPPAAPPPPPSAAPHASRSPRRPQDWAEQAWRAGARHVVFTAKHHDGFAMYDTKLSDYENLTGRGVPVARVRAGTLLGTGKALDWSTQTQPRDIHSASGDPVGELRVDIPSALLDDLCTVVAVDLLPPPA